MSFQILFLFVCEIIYQVFVAPDIFSSTQGYKRFNALYVIINLKQSLNRKGLIVIIFIFMEWSLDIKTIFGNNWLINEVFSLSSWYNKLILKLDSKASTV